MQTFENAPRPGSAATPAGIPFLERHFWAAALAMLLLHAVLSWLARPGGIGTIQDDAIYLFLARSLRAFGYHDLYLSGTPVHHMYPPGYPALLAALSLVFGERVALLQAFGIAASAAALGLVAATVRRLWSSAIALAVLAALIVNPHLVGAAGKIGSDAPYLLFSVAALVLLARAAPSPHLLAAAGAAAIAAALTRSVGVTLLAGIWAYWMLERRFLAAALLTVASAATVGLWLLWTAVAPEQYVGRSYVADATYRPRATRYPFAVLLLFRTLRNLSAYFGDYIPNRVGIPALPGPPVLNLIVALGVAATLLAGLAVMWKRWRPAALYLIAYGALLTVWTWSLGRFLNVVIPLLVLAVLLGVRALAGRVRPAWGVPALALCALALVLVGSVRAAKVVSARSACEWGAQLPPPECRAREVGAFYNALEYINRHTPPEVVLVSGKPAPAYFFTGRQTIPLGRARGQRPEAFIPFLNQQNARFVVLSRLHPIEYRVVAALLQENCTSLVLEAEFEPHTLVLRVLEPGAAAPNAGACHALARYRAAPFRAVQEQ